MRNDWIINTKLLPPELPTSQLMRPRLLEKATGYKGCRLTIVHAPAGYGKTTFLKQWHEHHLDNSGVAVWVSLDEEEKKTGLFFSYLIAGLQKVGVPCETLVTMASEGIDGSPIRSVAAAIINTLGQFDGELLLFFDDYHLISGKEVNELMQKMVFRLPDNVSIVLSSRSFPELSVQGLLNQGKVREITTTDLRFNLAETASVIDHRFQDFELEQLWGRTEGWPIACRMINVLLRNKLFEAGKIHSFSGRTTDLAAYITEQVFSSLDKNQQQFLTRTAIANRFTCDLASVLCDDMDCWGILENLARQDLFLVPLDAEGEWYRYHQLFREYLYERLRRNEGHTVHRLHIKAAEWLFDNGYIPEAVEHALKGNNTQLAAGIVDSSGGWRLIYQDKLDWLMNILERIEKPVLAAFPRLFMAEILALVKRGRLQEALCQANAMHDRTKGFELWAGKPLEPALGMEFNLVRKLILEDYKDLPVSETKLSFALTHLKSISYDDHILKALLHDALSSAYIDAGLVDKADSHINNARIMYKKAGFYYGSIYLYYHRANLYMECAKLREAEQELLKAKEVSNEHLEANFNIAANTSIYLAELAFMKSQVHEARRLLDTALDYVEQYDGWFDLYARAYTTAAGVALITTGIKNARAVLERARRTARERSLSRLMVLADLTEVRLLLLAGRLHEAEELAARMNINALARQTPDKDNLSVFIPERATVVLARLNLLLGRTDSVLDLLRPLADTLRAHERCRLLAEVWLLMAQAAYKLNDDGLMEDCFSKAVYLCMDEKYKRPFIDDGKEVSKIYNFLRNNRLIKMYSRPYRSFLAAIRRSIEEETHVFHERLAGFGITQKEYKVVTELVKGYTNKEIASILHISEDTVKYRLKKLFSKWDISSREAVILKAREKSLL